MIEVDASYGVRYAEGDRPAFAWFNNHYDAWVFMKAAEMVVGEHKPVRYEIVAV